MRTADIESSSRQQRGAKARMQVVMRRWRMLALLKPGGVGVAAAVAIVAVAMFALAACGDDDGEAGEPTLWFAAMIPVEATETGRPPPGVIRVFDLEETSSFEPGEAGLWLDLRWSPDGEWLYALEMETSGETVGTVVHLFEVFGEGHVRYPVDMEMTPEGGAWSPGSDRIAFKSSLSGAWVLGTDGTEHGPLELRDREGVPGLEPRWSPDGELFLAMAGWDIAVVDSGTTAAWWSEPEEWAPADSRPGTQWPSIMRWRWVEARAFDITVVEAGGEGRAWDLRGEFDGDGVAWTASEPQDWEDVRLEAIADSEALYEAVPYENAQAACQPQCGILDDGPVVVRIIYREEDSPPVDGPGADLAGAEAAVATIHEGEYREVRLGFDAGWLGVRAMRDFLVHAVVR